MDISLDQANAETEFLTWARQWGVGIPDDEPDCQFRADFNQVVYQASLDQQVDIDWPDLGPMLEPMDGEFLRGVSQTFPLEHMRE